MKNELSDNRRYNFFPSNRMVGFADGLPVGVKPASNSTAAPAVSKTSARPIYLNFFKRLFDIFAVLASLPFTVPVIGFCALALWFEGGKPFYTQSRLGAGGKRFSIFKLRSMVIDADKVLESYLASDPARREEWDRLQKLTNDPRITPVGRILRKTSLDELPQLFNVLRGDMSLVGPRPMMPDQLKLYGNPRAYFALKPGITGLWQVSARNAERFSYRNKVDSEYEQSVSLRTDLRILVKTVGVVLRPTGQ